MTSSTRPNAFTLVEMAIVLVIIGLIVGGVLVGTDIVAQAKLRRTHAYAAQIETAVQTFRNKYQAIPGDFRHATDIWGGADTSPWLCTSGTTTGPVMANCTINGNGDSFIKPLSGASPYNYWEAGGFWDHLAKAGLIEGGAYNGYSVGWWPNNSSGGNAAASPGSDYNNSWWTTTYADNSYWWSGSYILPAHYLQLGSTGGGNCAGASGGGAVLTVTEMKTLDSKYDDGKPDAGRIMVPNSNYQNGGWGCNTASGTTCLVVGAAVSPTYNNGAANIRTCSPLFRTHY